MPGASTGRTGSTGSSLLAYHYHPLTWLPRDLTIKTPDPVDDCEEFDFDYQRDDIYGGSVEQTCLGHWELNIAATEEIKARIPSEGGDHVLRLYEDVEVEQGWFRNWKPPTGDTHVEDDGDDDEDDDEDDDDDDENDNGMEASSSQHID